jgi:hypothetical protein
MMKDVRRSLMEIMGPWKTGQENILINGRWVIFKRTENLTDKRVVRLKELLKAPMPSIKAYLMREDFQRFWTYRMPDWAGRITM